MQNNILSRGIEILKNGGIKVFFKKFFVYVGERTGLLLPYALLKIKLFRANNLNELVDFAFDGICGIIAPFQSRREILNFLQIISKIKPGAVLEIGTARGGTLFLISRTASEDATIVTIDLPGGKFGGGYSEWRKFLYKYFALPKQKIYPLIMDSHRKETLEKVKSILNGRKIDLLFIDGDHSYEGVKRDFEMYSELVAEGGIIVFHDIVPGP
ncbi:hypothetical protein HRbin19_00741 [bacterium HR19]|nr:hypothetical protein HRbin19_00741 [bacterium HR19]